jgi:ankyrin repeat domain-containing protein 50
MNTGMPFSSHTWGNIKLIQVLFTAGADVREYGGRWRSTLQAASWMVHEEIVLLLLQAGADVNQEGGECGNTLQAALEWI